MSKWKQEKVRRCQREKTDWYELDRLIFSKRCSTFGRSSRILFLLSGLCTSHFLHSTTFLQPHIWLKPTVRPDKFIHGHASTRKVKQQQCIGAMLNVGNGILRRIWTIKKGRTKKQTKNESICRKTENNKCRRA